MSNIFILLSSVFLIILVLALVLTRYYTERQIKEDNKILEEIKKHMKTLEEIKSKRGK